MAATYVVQKTVRTQYTVEAESPQEAKEKIRGGEGTPVNETETYAAQLARKGAAGQAPASSQS